MVQPVVHIEWYLLRIDLAVDIGVEDLEEILEAVAGGILAECRKGLERSIVVIKVIVERSQMDGENAKRLIDTISMFRLE